MESRTLYEKSIQDRNLLRYVIGLIVRWKQNLKYVLARYIARRNGAEIGDGVIMSIRLARYANKNLHVGDHTSIQTDQIDMRCPVYIGNNVIIGANSEIVTKSHNIDSPDWEHKTYGIIIDDYVWIPMKVLILPSCRHIGRGAVISSGSVVVKNVDEMSVVSGNPAKEFRKRKCVHSSLVVESLLGGDFKIYRETWKKKKSL